MLTLKIKDDATADQPVEFSLEPDGRCVLLFAGRGKLHQCLFRFYPDGSVSRIGCVSPKLGFQLNRLRQIKLNEESETS